MLQWMTESPAGFVALLVVAFIVMLGAYLLPALLAWIMACPQRMTISLLNVFLGWTMFVWIAVLVWALASGKAERFDEDPVVRKEPWLR